MKALVLAVLLAAFPVFAATNLVNNGTFDSNCAGWNGVGSYYNFCWTGQNDFNGNPTNATPPSVVVNDFPNVVPQISQTISGLVLGAAYTIQIDAMSYFDCCNDPTTPGARVEIDGKQFDFLVVNNQPWKTYTFQFTYGGGSDLLVLSTQVNGTDSDAAFDNVSISGVPEPAAVVTVFSGLLLVMAGRLRRKS